MQTRKREIKSKNSVEVVAAMLLLMREFTTHKSISSSMGTGIEVEHISYYTNFTFSTDKRATPFSRYLTKKARCFLYSSWIYVKLGNLVCFGSCFITIRGISCGAWYIIRPITCSQLFLLPYTLTFSFLFS